MGKEKGARGREGKGRGQDEAGEGNGKANRETQRKGGKEWTEDCDGGGENG